MFHQTLAPLTELDPDVQGLIGLLTSAQDAAKLAGTYNLRSNLLRAVAIMGGRNEPRVADAGTIPARIIQYWNDVPPPDVAAMIDTWREVPGWEHQLFDDDAARTFIAETYGAEAVAAYDYAAHPAFRSDIFRYMYLAAHGGLYVDADERRRPESDLSHFLRSGFLITPRCWVHGELEPLGLKHREVRPWRALELGLRSDTTGFYVNNSPLGARAGHPLMLRMSEIAVSSVLDCKRKGEPPSIHSATSPQIWTVVFATYLFDGQDEDRLAETCVALDWLRTEAEEVWAKYKSTDRYWGTIAR